MNADVMPHPLSLSWSCLLPGSLMTTCKIEMHIIILGIFTLTGDTADPVGHSLKVADDSKELLPLLEIEIYGISVGRRR